jgi:hypothetical protein
LVGQHIDESQASPSVCCSPDEQFRNHQPRVGRLRNQVIRIRTPVRGNRRERPVISRWLRILAVRQLSDRHR